jgi:hypothetical protein
MTSKIFRILSRSTFLVWTISTQIGGLEGFSPGDVSSIAAAVAAAHIGKPPPFHSPQVRERSATTGATRYGCSKSDVSLKFDVIGKVPRSKAHSNQNTIRDSAIHHQTIDGSGFPSKVAPEKLSFPNIAPNLEVDVNMNDFKMILFSKRHELDNLISDITSTENDKSSIDQNMNIGFQEDNFEEVPTVYAVFCGYRATVEELSRLRSANVI